MKKLLPVSLLILTTTICFAELKGLMFEPKEFPGDTYEIRFSSAEMEMLEVNDLYSQPYNYAYKNKEKDYELRYILFNQTDEISDFEEYKMQTELWAMMIITDITGDENNALNTTNFDEEDVKKEFNADYGFTNFSYDVETDYSEGYKYMMINFYCKENTGIMCQTILFNDLEWTKTRDFNKNFHGFNFY